MKHTGMRPHLRGFTLIELVITLALVGLLSMFTLPLYDMAVTRFKEHELRQALRTIRDGIDAYKAAADSGKIPRDAGESGYPKTLEQLTEPIELAAKPDLNTSVAAQRMVILRKLPRDPFNDEPDMTAEMTWSTRAYASRSDDPRPGADVFDVTSKSDRKSLDGTVYSSW